MTTHTQKLAPRKRLPLREPPRRPSLRRMWSRCAGRSFGDLTTAITPRVRSFVPSPHGMAALRQLAWYAAAIGAGTAILAGIVAVRYWAFT